MAFASRPAGVRLELTAGWTAASASDPDPSHPRTSTLPAGPLGRSKLLLWRYVVHVRQQSRRVAAACGAMH